MIDKPEVFFTSDNHFFHKNILKFARDTRIGKDVVEMNEQMIKIWNEQVTDDDTVYCLGDFCFGKADQAMKIIPQLNGKLHLVKGNHDHWINAETAAYFESINNYLRIRHCSKDVIMFHYPIYEWDKMHYGSYHLFGHVHGKPQMQDRRAMDVGIDARPEGDMKLWTWAEIDAKLSKMPIFSHH